MPFGYLDTQYIDFPAGLDAAYLSSLRTRAGVEFPRVLREIDSRLAALNRTLDPLVASLITATTEALVDSSGAPALEVDERGEYTLARPQLVDGAAHMLPIRGYDVSLGFTEDGLEGMSLHRILLNVDSLLAGFRRLYRRQALKRLFSNAEVRVAPTTTDTSPGFVGSGTGENVFSRPFPDGQALPNGYTHYLFANTSNAGELATVLLAGRDQLRRWHAGPYDLIAPSGMLPLVEAIAGDGPSDSFVSAGSALVRPALGEAEARVDATAYVGVLFGDVRVQIGIEDTQSPNLALFKSYGPLDPRNPLAWRYDEKKGRSAVLRYRSLYPLDQAVVKQDFGIGVNDRTGAVLIRAANGAAAYVSPTDL
jgi:hypothetical protein